MKEEKIATKPFSLKKQQEQRVVKSEKNTLQQPQASDDVRVPTLHQGKEQE